MNDLETQVRRMRRGIRALTWIVAIGAAFDLWECVRLVAIIRAAWWGQP